MRPTGARRPAALLLRNAQRRQIFGDIGHYHVFFYRIVERELTV